MNMTDPSSIKYQVKAKINADGIVDKPDVVGAIFGQTEGLLGDNLDLRDLQKSGRIGRVEVEIVSKGGKSEGIIYMSSSLDQVETAIISATLETIDRVGPCKASIKVIGIEDVRVTKREQIAERAKELLGILMDQAKGSGSNLTQNIRESLQVEEITTYGKERCPAGPNVKNSEAIIIVEGRSDVLNLLRAGIKNAIAVEGTNIPKSVQDLSKERVTTAFVRRSCPRTPRTTSGTATSARTRRSSSRRRNPQRRSAPSKAAGPTATIPRRIPASAGTAASAASAETTRTPGEGTAASATPGGPRRRPPRRWASPEGGSRGRRGNSPGGTPSSTRRPQRRSPSG